MRHFCTFWPDLRPKCLHQVSPFPANHHLQRKATAMLLKELHLSQREQEGLLGPDAEVAPYIPVMFKPGEIWAPRWDLNSSL